MILIQKPNLFYVKIFFRMCSDIHICDDGYIYFRAIRLDNDDDIYKNFTVFLLVAEKVNVFMIILKKLFLFLILGHMTLKKIYFLISLPIKQ